jgi:hypothetical protein
MEEYYIADLYEAAFLMAYGAHFRRVCSYHKNNEGRGFSIISLEGVTIEMLDKLYDRNSSVNFAKFREQRIKIKRKIDKFAKTHPHTSLTSKEIYDIHKKLKQQYINLRAKYGNKPYAPKRVMNYENTEDFYSQETRPFSKVQSVTLGSGSGKGILKRVI